MRELKSPPPSPEPWIVWDVSQPTNFCTVTARTWMLACQEGRLRLGCEKVDAGLESERPLERIHRVDACILCNMFPCICSKSNPPPPEVKEPTVRECHQNLYASFMTTSDLKLKAVCRDKMLALIFKKLFDL
jgi:hypothetical protein